MHGPPSFVRTKVNEDKVSLVPLDCIDCSYINRVNARRHVFAQTLRLASLLDCKPVRGDDENCRRLSVGAVQHIGAGQSELGRAQNPAI